MLGLSWLLLVFPLVQIFLIVYPFLMCISFVNKPSLISEYFSILIHVVSKDPLCTNDIIVLWLSHQALCIILYYSINLFLHGLSPIFILERFLCRFGLHVWEQTHCLSCLSPSHHYKIFISNGLISWVVSSYLLFYNWFSFNFLCSLLFGLSNFYLRWSNFYFH